MSEKIRKIRIVCDCDYQGESAVADESGRGESHENIYDPETGAGAHIFRARKTYLAHQPYCPRCGRGFPAPEKSVKGPPLC